MLPVIWLICAAMIKCLSYGMGYGELVAKPEEIIPAIQAGLCFRKACNNQR